MLSLSVLQYTEYSLIMTVALQRMFLYKNAVEPYLDTFVQTQASHFSTNRQISLKACPAKNISNPPTDQTAKPAAHFSVFQAFLRVWHPTLCSCDITRTLTYLLDGADSFLRSYLVLQLVKKSPAFLEPECSSPYSQVAATCPYPQPTPSSPHNPFPLPEDPS